uniref:Nuclear inhibitor of protein phosphatase 1-like n=1 Tax=Saccoglossus kowalevskii TaxID=10224 RepID=A0ABM0GT28_SACKO|nr:PREDICTED: nuclear inhibitor of protein phosphatase 1-like [Saccoglossus kowalevskii]
MANKFEVPTWAGKPPPGLHLDVMKDTKMVEKLMVDEKKCYLFGRNPDVCDFCIDHQSCSRVHAALVYHKHLNRSFIIDLNSTHGTFLGTIRLEGSKPQQVPIDSTLRFGASTRSYAIREKPQTIAKSAMKTDKEEKENSVMDELHGGLLGLPEEETELDNLTEFNTAHNKRLGVAGNVEDTGGTTDITRPPLKRKRKNSHVSFQDGEEVINPGKGNKKKTESVPNPSMAENITRRLQSFSYTRSLYADLPASSDEQMQISPTSPTTPPTGPYPTTPGGASFNFVPNLAPEVGPSVEPTSPSQAQAAPVTVGLKDMEPRKKFFPKEAWPGKKPTQSLLL